MLNIFEAVNSEAIFALMGYPRLKMGNIAL
jgi:hypothetical protein